MAEERKAIHAYLTPESHDRWHDFVAGEGVSLSGIMEILGRDPGAYINDDAVKAARRLDAARRRRGPDAEPALAAVGTSDGTAA